MVNTMRAGWGSLRLGTVAMVGPSDGSRRALGRFEDCLERHHEEARYHEGVIEQAGTYEEVGD